MMINDARTSSVSSSDLIAVILRVPEFAPCCSLNVGAITFKHSVDAYS